MAVTDTILQIVHVYRTTIVHVHIFGSDIINHRRNDTYSGMQMLPWELDM